MSTSGSNEFNAIITRINDNRQAYDKLSNAIFGGNTRDVINVINTGIDVSGPIDENGQNILHLASYAGLLDLIVYFMNELSPEKRPQVNTKDFHGWTPLLAAASNGHIPVCHFLLTNGADPKITNDQKTTPLHYLCRKKEAASFVKTGRDTTKQRQQQNKKDSESYFGVLENLINAGISVDSRNYMGETPLMQAAAKGNEEAVRFLLEHKADIKVANNKGDTALFYATNAGHEPIVKLIAKKKGDTKEKLITHEVKLDHLSEVFGLMRNVDSGVNLADRRGFFITHRNCFSGSELVDWILKNLSIRTRDDASRYAQKYLDSNFIVGISKKKKFKDSPSVLYRFASDAPVEEVNTVESKEEKIGLEQFDRINVLGRGAFGKVLLVRKKGNKKEYAMKIIEKSKVMDKPRDFKNLMSEKRILQNDCPFLVHLYYSFQTPTDFYLVMDFLGGGDLNFHLKREKRFSEKIVQFIAAELVLALSYLHSRGIIYRDLKPQNILLDVDGHICLADFGLSKEVAGNGANLHTACGTPSYSAPEVLEGHPYAKSVDWWSFGICLYQFLVGKTPFHFDGDFAKLVNAVLYEEVVYPSDAISDRARSFLQGVLQKNPDKRFDDEDVIKRHPFFTGIDWEKLAVKKVPSPFKVAPNALENFDPKYTNLGLYENKKKEAKPVVEDFTVILN